MSTDQALADVVPSDPSNPAPAEKVLLLSVSCANEFASDTPKTFGVSLDKETINRILSLAKEVKRLDVYSIEDHFYDGSWSDLSIDDVMDLPDPVSALTDAEASVSATMLQVFKESFVVTAFPKHGGDDSILTSRIVEFPELGNSSLFVKE